MESIKRYKNLLLILAGAIVIYFVYNNYIQKNTTPDLSVSPVSPQTIIASDRFLSQLTDLDKVTLDDRFFQSPEFLALKDATIELTLDANAYGRINPFAAIGVDVVSSSDIPGFTSSTTTKVGTPPSSLNIKKP